MTTREVSSNTEEREERTTARWAAVDDEQQARDEEADDEPPEMPEREAAEAYELAPVTCCGDVKFCCKRR